MAEVAEVAAAQLTAAEVFPAEVAVAEAIRIQRLTGKLLNLKVQLMDLETQVPTVITVVQNGAVAVVAALELQAV
jgi:hypothetical protein